jgi:hypothetical protein
MRKSAARTLFVALAALTLAGLIPLSDATAATTIPGTSRLAPHAAVGTPVFSVWRNLVRHSHVFADLEYATPDIPDYMHSPAPLPAALADTCCAVRPGQALALVRQGKVVATGRVGRLYAADVPAGGDSYRAYFDAEGFADSVVDGRALPYNTPDSGPNDRFDLYIIGDVAITPCAPRERPWAVIRDELAAVAAEAIDRRAFSTHSLPDSLHTPGTWPTPACLADFWFRNGALTEIDVPLGDGSAARIQSVRWYTTSGFVRVASPRMLEPALLPGRIEYLLRVDGVPYLVMRHSVPGTGMWGYSVYRLWADRAPERVLNDASWST